MRPKVVFAVCLFALLAAGLVVYLKRPPTPSIPDATEATAIIPAPSVSPPAGSARSNTPADGSPAVDHQVRSHASAATAVATNQNYTAAERDAEIDRLTEWAASGEAAALPLILADLKCPDKFVRNYAIEAAKQFGSRDAIPALNAAAAGTDDTEEKIAYLQAVQFLSLPPMETRPKTPEEAARLRALVKARQQQNAAQQNPPPPNQPSPVPPGTGQ